METVGSVQSPLLVGRDDLLRVADERISESSSGRGHLLMLAGEAGIGKTRMVTTVMRKAAAAGFRIAKGDLAPHDRQVPLASMLDLARTMCGRTAFGPLGRELLELPSEQAGDTLGARRRLVHQMADRILASALSPTLLAFEDLQWADEMSLEVIGELARRCEDRPLLLLAAYRLDELPAGSLHREWRSRLLRQRLGEEFRLERLTHEETAVVTTLILGTGLPAPRDVIDAIHRRSNGIPLHIEELLAALDDGSPIDGRAIREAVVPDTIEDAVLARVARLSEDARAVARAGAVIGRCFVPEVLAGVMDRPPADLDEPLEELVASTILYPFDFMDRGYYDFRHQLLRDALYGTIPPAELRRFHARAGEFCALLVGATEIHASIHFERAGLRSQAYRAALAAARAANAISSRQEAFELYARAVANTPEDLAPLDRASLYEAYGEAAFAVDNVPIAEETARIARASFLEAGRPLNAAAQLVNLAGLARRDVRPPEERSRLLEQAEGELAALPDSPEQQSLLADLRIDQAMQDIDAMRLDGAAAMLDAAARAARAAPHADRVGHLEDVEFFRAQVDVLAGRRVQDGIATVLRIARGARDRNDESTGVTAYRVAAAMAVRVMDYRTAEAGLREGLRYADAIEQSYCRRIMAATSAHVAWAAGRWDEAIATAEIELVERGTRRGTLGSREVIGFVACGRGELDRARAVLTESLEMSRIGGEVELVLGPLWGLAETELLARQSTIAISHCDDALALAESTGEGALLVPFVVTGVRAHLADRRPDLAERWFGRTSVLLGDWVELARPALAHGQGLLRIADGSTTAARSALAEAVGGWDDRGRLWEATWARLDLAGCLMRMSRFGEAATLLEQVRRTAAAVRSTPLLERAEDLARRARGRGFESEPWRPLTAREFEVARSIAEGKTNAEIAAGLAIAPKTASSHVEHILAKLGVTRRAEIAAWVTTISVGSQSEPGRSRNVPGVTNGGAGAGAAVAVDRRT